MLIIIKYHQIMNKIEFFFKRPKVVVITGEARETLKQAVLQVLGQRFKVGEDFLIVDKDFEFFLKYSKLPVLAASHIGKYHPEKEVFAGEEQQALEIYKIAEALPFYGYSVLNFDDETIRDIKNKSKAHSLTFGLGQRADIRATDIVLKQFPNFGTNFKINYHGKIVPVWLKNLFGKENIYAALGGVAVGQIFGLNLVQISEALKKYQGVEGRLRLIEGIKQSFILDNSGSSSVFSATEGLSILRKIEARGKKIAVMGDILGIGKYTIEAHEAIGETVAKSADLLFTFGARAKFIAKGARGKGMSLEKIFQYDTVKDVGISLQREMHERDFVLISGIKEEAQKIIQEVSYRQ